MFELNLPIQFYDEQKNIKCLKIIKNNNWEEEQEAFVKYFYKSTIKCTALVTIISSNNNNNHKKVKTCFKLIVLSEIMIIIICCIFFLFIIFYTHKLNSYFLLTNLIHFLHIVHAIWISPFPPTFNLHSKTNLVIDKRKNMIECKCVKCTLF